MASAYPRAEAQSVSSWTQAAASWFSPISRHMLKLMCDHVLPAVPGGALDVVQQGRLPGCPLPRKAGLPRPQPGTAEQAGLTSPSLVPSSPKTPTERKRKRGTNEGVFLLP